MECAFTVLVLHLAVVPNLKKTKLTKFLLISVLTLTLFSSCNTISKLTTKDEKGLNGYYFTEQHFLILENDSTFEFGKRGGVIAIYASGTFEVDGIQLLLSVDKTHSFYEDQKNKVEQGYIDYENNLIYAFGKRLKKE